jgi:hypothetical protein
LLDNHANICAPAPPHLHLIFHPLRAHYRDLREAGNAQRLIGDLIQCANLAYNCWDLEASAAEIVRTYNPRSFQACVHALWEVKAKESGKTRFASKDIESFVFVDTIRSYCPDTRFIYLVRDPRDVVASWMKNPIAYWTPYNAALNWIRNQEVCLDLVKTQGVLAHTIHYEQLIGNAEEVMAGVLDAVGEKPDSACFSTDAKKAEELGFNPLWENLAKPILRNNSRKFESILSHDEIEMVETLCQPLMKEFGYAPVTGCKWSPPKRFFQDNRKRANEKKAEMDEWMKANMPLLVEKHAYIDALRERLSVEFPVRALGDRVGAGDTGIFAARLRRKISAVLGGV